MMELICNRCGKCTICTLIRRNEKNYGALFGLTPDDLGGPLPRSTEFDLIKDANPNPGPCKYRSEDHIRNGEAAKLGLSTAYNWYQCNNPETPLGLYVCPCKGCHAGCKGFDSIKTETVV